MADPPQLPTRFVSQSEIESTNAKKEEAWRAAYARIGQEPPVREVDEKYDGRSLAEVSDEGEGEGEGVARAGEEGRMEVLKGPSDDGRPCKGLLSSRAEKLAANRAAKQEEFENSHKLSAQFRSLDPDEITFLDEVAVRRMEKEKRTRDGDEEALRAFRAAVQARDTAPLIPGPSSSPTLSKSHAETLPTMASGSGLGTSVGSTSTTNPTENSPMSPPGTKPTSPTSKHPQSPTSKHPQPPAPPPTKTRSIKAGLKGVVVQRKRSKAGAGGAAIAKGTVAEGAGVAGVAREMLDVEGTLGGTSKQGDGPGEGEVEEGDRKRRRVG